MLEILTVNECGLNRDVNSVWYFI